MKNKEFYSIVLKAMKKSNFEKKKIDCSDCFVHNLQRELCEEHIKLNLRSYRGTDCYKILFCLQDLGVIKILSGISSRENWVDCDNLKIKFLSNPDGNKI